MIKNLLKIVCAGLMAAVCLGCAHPDLIAKNESYVNVVAKLGKPDSDTLNADGSRRIVYSMQPMGQQVYEMVFNPKGELIYKENILQEKYFTRIQPKIMNEQDILVLLGEPCEKQTYKGLGEYSYMYRYLDGVAFPMALWIDFDSKNNEVLRWVISIDPWSQKGTEWDTK